MTKHHSVPHHPPPSPTLPPPFLILPYLCKEWTSNRLSYACLFVRRRGPGACIAKSYRNNKRTASCIPLRYGGAISTIKAINLHTSAGICGCSGGAAGGERWWWGGLTLTAQPSKVGLVEGICFDKSAKQQYVITFHATLITSA